MPRLPDRLLPSHLGAGALSESANRGWSPPLAAGAGSADRGFPCWPQCGGRFAAGAPAVSPPRARALPLGRPGRLQSSAGLRLDSSGGRGGAARELLRDHVTGTNMAAPSGVHLLVRRGKHLEDRPAGGCTVARALSPRVHRVTHPRSDISAHMNVLSVLPIRAGTQADTLTRRRNR